MKLGFGSPQDFHDMRYSASLPDIRSIDAYTHDVETPFNSLCNLPCARPPTNVDNHQSAAYLGRGP